MGVTFVDLGSGGAYDARKCREKECFGNDSGFCTCLTTTYYNRKCPFFKTKEQAEAEWKKYGGLK